MEKGNFGKRQNHTSPLHHHHLDLKWMQFDTKLQAETPTSLLIVFSNQDINIEKQTRFYINQNRVMTTEIDKSLTL